VGSWWVTDALQNGGPVLLGSWILWVIGSIVLHELAHGWAAIRCGDDTPVATGHMTWNPYVHMGPFSLLMFGLIGIAWGQMPVQPLNFRGRYDDAYVAFAGPAMNLVLALLTAIAGGMWIVLAQGNVAPNVYDNTRTFLAIGCSMNIALCLFNLFPVPPLDGSRIVADFVPSYERFIRSEQGAVAALIGFALLFTVAGKHIFFYAVVAGSFATGLVAIAIQALTGHGTP
jgi:Zn-dependent protease